MKLAFLDFLCSLWLFGEVLLTFLFILIQTGQSGGSHRIERTMSRLREKFVIVRQEQVKTFPFGSFRLGRIVFSRKTTYEHAAKHFRTEELTLPSHTDNSERVDIIKFKMEVSLTVSTNISSVDPQALQYAPRLRDIEDLRERFRVFGLEVGKDTITIDGETFKFPQDISTDPFTLFLKWRRDHQIENALQVKRSSYLRKVIKFLKSNPREKLEEWAFFFTLEEVTTSSLGIPLTLDNFHWVFGEELLKNFTSETDPKVIKEHGIPKIRKLANEFKSSLFYKHFGFKLSDDTIKSWLDLQTDFEFWDWWQGREVKSTDFLWRLIEKRMKESIGDSECPLSTIIAYEGYEKNRLKSLCSSLSTPTWIIEPDALTVIEKRGNPQVHAKYYLIIDSLII